MGVIAEVKTLEDMVLAPIHRRMEALIEYCEKNGVGLLLTNGKHSIDRLLNLPHNLEFESLLKMRLYEPGAGTLHYSEYDDIAKRCNGKYRDLLPS